LILERPATQARSEYDPHYWYYARHLLKTTPQYAVPTGHTSISSVMGMMKRRRLESHGERDGFMTVEHGKAYEEGIPQAEFMTIPNAGHLPHIEALEACANIICNFLRKSGA